MPKLTEHQIQAAYFDWARRHPVARRAFAIPNGGARSKATAGRLKAEGVRAGVLDVMLPVPRGGAAGLWIEFKSKDGYPSAEQRTEIDELVRDGYAVLLCRDAERAAQVTQAYLDGQVGVAFLVVR